MFKEKQLKVSYKARSSEPKSYHIHPIGLVSKSCVMYLVGTINDFSDIRQFSLGRFVSAEISDEPCRVPKDFELEDYILNQGEFQYPISSVKSTIELRVSSEFIFFFNENELGSDQKVSRMSNGYFLVEASTLITEELEWWLLGRADHIEVLQPQMLRDRLKVRLKDAMENYDLYAS